MIREGVVFIRSKRPRRGEQDGRVQIADDAADGGNGVDARLRPSRPFLQNRHHRRHFLRQISRRLPQILLRETVHDRGGGVGRVGDGHRVLDKLVATSAEMPDGSLDPVAQIRVRGDGNAATGVVRQLLVRFRQFVRQRLKVLWLSRRLRDYALRRGGGRGGWKKALSIMISQYKRLYSNSEFPGYLKMLHDLVSLDYL